MFKRRDIPPVLLLLLLIILVMLTLSQILVVHNGRYGKNVHNMRKLQLELREMDINLHSLMMQNVPSIELNRRLLQNEINAGRIAAIIAQAAKTHRALPDRSHRANDKNRTRLTEQEQRSLFRDHRNMTVLRTKQDNREMLPYVSSSRQLETNKMHSPNRLTEDVHLSVSNVTKKSLLSSNASGSLTFGRSSSSSIHSPPPFSSSSSSPSGSLGVVSHKEQSPSFQPYYNTVISAAPSKLNSSSTDPVVGTSELKSRLNQQMQERKESPLSPNNQNTQNNVIQAPPNGANNELALSKAGVMRDSHVSRKFRSSASSISKLKKSVRINYCPSIPPNLKGRVFVNFDHKHNFTEGEIVRQNPHIRPGGMSRPTDCVARHRVAVVVPYRDRWDHLMILLSHLHPILERQQLDYRIFVVEQSGRDTFNKARIMNIAFVEALKQNNFQCFVFHDVDLVPEDDRNMYSCPTQPRHMSVAIDEMGYKLAYQELVGGVLNMRTEHFQRVNGYSNLYWGWGAEDDDMAYRIMHVGLKITRPPEGVARYKMVKHTKRKPADWRKRAKLLYTGTRRFQFDGLNSLQYKVVHIKKLPLFSHVLVDIGKPPRGF